MTDLLAIVITVQPTADVMLPAYLGRAVHAQTLRWIGQSDPALAQRWHDDDGPKPITCSSLLGGKRVSDGMRLLKANTAYSFRVTALNVETCAALLPLLVSPPPSAELDGVTMTVTGITADSTVNPWAGRTTYDALAAPFLLARAAPPRRVTLRFASPVTFRQRDRGVPIPLPELVFGGLADRWNTFSPVGISPEVRAFCETGIGMSAFALRSRALPVKESVVQVGAVGTAGYSVLRYDRYWMSLVTLLAEYVFFAGAGRMTTMGMGQARRVE